MEVRRTEKHIIDRQSKWYALLMDKCHSAKNIYNHGNYFIRKEFTENGKWLRYGEVEQLVKTDITNTDYWDWDLANSGQQVLRRLDKNWKSFFESMRSWKKDPSRFNGMPKMPKYLKKDGVTEFILTTNQAKLKSDGLIHFPKSLLGLTIKPQFIQDTCYVKFNACRIVPKHDRVVAELIYTATVPDSPEVFHNVGSIDLGVDNFVTFVDNLGNSPIIVNGKGLKSCNKYYNELIAKEKSKLDCNKNQVKYSHALHTITNKRNDKINQFINRITVYLVKHCVDLDINVVVIGQNSGWKQRIDIGNINNQTFMQVPYQRFIDNLTYKCENAGIKVIVTNESYTSGTSFLDGEQPIPEQYNKQRRAKRGLFISNSGQFINADVNAAYQIMKKVFHDVEIPVDRGLVFNPIRVNFNF